MTQKKLLILMKSIINNDKTSQDAKLEFLSLIVDFELLKVYNTKDQYENSRER